MKNWNELASKASVAKTGEALKTNGIDCYVVDNKEQAREKVLELLPPGTEVMNMTSRTLETINIVGEINDSGRFSSVRNILATMEKGGQGREKKRLGAAPKWAIGSVHAVTETGDVFIASNTGSQLPAYAYGSDHVIWVIGTQKIVHNKEEAFNRIYEHCLPLESERAKKAYGLPGSFISKILVVNREVQPGRITAILVNEVLGF
jgi:hypothetical protein